MSDPQTPQAKKELTKAEAAKRVKRLVTVKRPDGEPAVKQVAVKEDEVFAFRDYGTHVVVVTTDGQKLSSATASEKAAEEAQA